MSGSIDTPVEDDSQSTENSSLNGQDIQGSPIQNLSETESIKREPNQVELDDGNSTLNKEEQLVTPDQPVIEDDNLQVELEDSDDEQAEEEIDHILHSKDAKKYEPEVATGTQVKPGEPVGEEAKTKPTTEEEHIAESDTFGTKDEAQAEPIEDTKQEDVTLSVSTQKGKKSKKENKKTSNANSAEVKTPEPEIPTVEESQVQIEEEAERDVGSITMEEEETENEFEILVKKESEAQEELRSSVNETQTPTIDHALEGSVEDKSIDLNNLTQLSTRAPTEETLQAEPVDTPNIKNRHEKKPSMAKSIPPDNPGFIFGLCIVDFHHIRGPEIEYWIDDETNEFNQQEQIAKYSKIWPQLPFQGLPDGAHLFDETFTNFTLLYDEVTQTCPELPIKPKIPGDESPQEQEDQEDLEDQRLVENWITLFGCACIRQLNSDQMINVKNPSDIKRSIIQKSIVLITRYPITIQLKEKLSIITSSYFSQFDFEDKSIINALYENISIVYNRSGYKVEDDDIYELPTTLTTPTKAIKESDFYTGLNLKELVITFKRDLMVLFKALLLDQRIMFFSKDLNKLSNLQYSLLSLIPNLLLSLSDAGSPLLGNLSKHLSKPTSLKSSDRNSMLKFMGLPLQLFSKGGLFQPYLTLQQLDQLSNPSTKSYVVGCSNDIILLQKQRLADIVITIESGGGSDIGEDTTVKLEILNSDLKDKLTLTPQDKRFIDLIISDVVKNDQLSSLNDDQHAVLSKTLNYNLSMDSKIFKGGDDFIRYQFEDYLIGMLSSIKYDNFLTNSNLEKMSYLNLNTYPNSLEFFNIKYIDYFREQTKCYQIFNKSTDDELFNFFEPKHVCGDLVTGTVFFKSLINKWSANNQPTTGVHNKQSPSVAERSHSQSASLTQSTSSELVCSGETNKTEVTNGTSVEETSPNVTKSSETHQQPTALVNNALSSVSNFFGNLKKPQFKAPSNKSGNDKEVSSCDNTMVEAGDSVLTDASDDSSSAVIVDHEAGDQDDQEKVVNSTTSKPKFSFGWGKKT